MSYEIVTIEVTTYLEDLESAAWILRGRHYHQTADAIEQAIAALPEPEWEPEWEPEAEQVAAYQRAVLDFNGLTVTDTYATDVLKHLHEAGLKL